MKKLITFFSVPFKLKNFQGQVNKPYKEKKVNLQR